MQRTVTTIPENIFDEEIIIENDEYYERLIDEILEALIGGPDQFNKIHEAKRLIREHKKGLRE